MSQENSLTSIVYNVPYAKQLGLAPFYYRWRSCEPNFPNRTQTSVGGFTPAEQYQKLKVIQDTVRLYGSLYVANLAPLTVYKKPISDPDLGFYGVCWNQMSDRPVPSVQRATIPTGYATALNRRHTSVTSSKPGSQTPGGKGCDIKHNSYDRYLNRLKGKGPMRRGVVPANFGKPIPFNPAFPVYGGKTMKTNIVNGCDCPEENAEEQNLRIYDNPLWQPYPSSNYGFAVGTYVYAIQTGNDFYTRAIVLSKTEEGVYTIQFDNGFIQTETNVSNLLTYFPCNCGAIKDGITFQTGFLLKTAGGAGLGCTFTKEELMNLVN